MRLLDQAQTALKLHNGFEVRAEVTKVTGLIIEGNGPMVAVGTNVQIENSSSSAISAQVVGFRDNRTLFMPYEDIKGVLPGSKIIATTSPSKVVVSEHLLGRVVDPFGFPLDGRPLVLAGEAVDLYREPPNPISRTRISDVFDLGVRALNSLLTVGKGQRLGIMSGSGVGKSTLLGMIAKHSVSDVNVIALVGERGREVREFIERDLGPEGLKRSIVVVATGDKSPLLRIRAATYATAIAEFYRDQGQNVVLMVDSVTRFAMAQREIGLAVGEPPSTKGYTPSVFSLLPRLLERAGTCDGTGSITGLYTVLVEGDDMNEPIADSVRGILDGHIVLSRELAQRGHFPAVDVLQSTSRVMSDIVPETQLELASLAREVLATYKNNEDLITIGAYKSGQNPQVDRAVQLMPSVTKFLRQKPNEHSNLEVSIKSLVEALKYET